MEYLRSLDRDTRSCALVYMLVTTTETTDIGRSATHVESNHGQIGLFAVSGHRVTDHSARRAGKNRSRPIESERKRNARD